MFVRGRTSLLLLLYCSPWPCLGTALPCYFGLCTVVIIKRQLPSFSNPVLVIIFTSVRASDAGLWDTQRANLAVSEQNGG